MSELDDIAEQSFEDSLEFAGEPFTVRSLEIKGILSQITSGQEPHAIGFLDSKAATVSFGATKLQGILGVDTFADLIGETITLTKPDATTHSLRVASLVHVGNGIVDYLLQSEDQLS